MRAPTIVLAAAALACAPPDREIRLERLAAERRAIEATFDHLEDRLTVNQARVRFWQEMRERHESVSAIACVVQDEHLQQMSARLPPPRSALHRARVAAAPRAPGAARFPAAAGGGVGGGD